MVKNKYDLTNDYGIGYDRKGCTFLFDLEDYDKIKSIRWNVNIDCVMGTLDKHPIKLHRLVMDAPNDTLVDHINCDTTDNRKHNLRFADKTTNGINRGANKNNKLGVKGVFKKRNKYVAQIKADSKRRHLGTFNTIEEARKARLEAELKYFDEFAYLYDNEKGNNNK